MEEHFFGIVAEALNYLNNTVGYGGYIYASIEVASIPLDENFTRHYVLHGLAIIRGGADNTILHNGSGTGMLAFRRLPPT